MKQLNTRFILSNIVTAIMLVVLMPYYRSEVDAMRERGSAPTYAYVLLVTVFIGMVAMNVKSYDLACRAERRLKWYGTAFLGITYLGGMVANLMMFSEAVRLGNLLEQGGWILLLLVILMVYCLASVVMESNFLQYRPKFRLPQPIVQLAGFLSMCYISVGINLCWYHVVLRMEIYKMSAIASIMTYVCMMLFFVFSFERLFWYEIMQDSETKRDNLKTFLAILLVMAAGIVPMYVG